MQKQWTRPFPILFISCYELIYYWKIWNSYIVCCFFYITTTRDAKECKEQAYKGGPKNNGFCCCCCCWGERGVTSVCSCLVRVRDCPPHQLAKRRPWGKVYRISVIFFLSLCHCFRWFFDGRLKRTCLHQEKKHQKQSQCFERLLKKKLWARQGFTNGFLGSNLVTCHLKTNRDLGVLQQAELTKTFKKFAMQ